MTRIYLDHGATTPLNMGVRTAMSAVLDSEFGNPSSLHAEGRRAKDVIDAARETLSAKLGCLFAEVLFTSGGTEAANLAILGTALKNHDGSRKTILLGSSEHHCVINTAETLTTLGFRVEWIPVNSDARINLDAFRSMLSDEVLLVSCMHANNELGSINPIREIADLSHDCGALLHTDAVQTFHAPGMDWTVTDLDADLVTLSAHKIYGPKGVGAIYTRAGVILKPLVTGGGQEREMRGGTENVASIAGFAAAVRAHRANPDLIRQARDRFLAKLVEIGAIVTLSNMQSVLSGHAHVRFPGIDAETVLIVLDRMGVSASSGAACSSGSVEPSHVLLACGYDADVARQGLRFTFGRDATIAQANEAASRVATAISQIQSHRSK